MIPQNQCEALNLNPAQYADIAVVYARWKFSGPGDFVITPTTDYGHNYNPPSKFQRVIVRDGEITSSSPGGRLFDENGIANGGPIPNARWQPFRPTDADRLLSIIPCHKDGVTDRYWYSSTYVNVGSYDKMSNFEVVYKDQAWLDPRFSMMLWLNATPGVSFYLVRIG